MAPPTRTQRILEWGERRRGVWQPEEGSLTLRAYRWWAKSSGQAPKQENFCHYWRVALIWAPLRWLTMPLRWLARLLRNPKIQLGFAMGAMLALVTAAIASTSGVFVAITIVVACLAAAAYVAAGAGLGMDWLLRKVGGQPIEWVEALRKRSSSAYEYLWALLLPAAGVTILGLWAIAALAGACVWAGSRLVAFFTFRIMGWRHVTPFTVVLAGSILYFLVMMGVQSPGTLLLGALILGAAILAIAAMVFGFALLMVSVEANVQKRRERRASAGVSLEKKASPRRRASPLRRALEPFALMCAALRAWKMGICPIVEIPRSNSD